MKKNVNQMCVCFLSTMFLICTSMKAQPKENFKVAIFLYPGVEILDFAGPTEVFAASPGFQVYTVSVDGEKIRSQGIVDVTPNYSMDSAPMPDIVVFPGGGVDAASNNPKIINWVKKIVTRGGTAMSVCTGAFVLAKTGYLDGLNITTHYSGIKRLQEELPSSNVLEHIRFVDNGNIMTTAGISAGIDGSLYMVSKIKGIDVAKATAFYMEYDKWSPDNGRVDFVNEYIKQLKEKTYTLDNENLPVFSVSQNTGIPYEGELRNLALELENKNNNKEAAQVLECTIKWYPNSATTFNQLSEVYSKLGKAVPIKEIDFITLIDGGKIEEAYSVFETSEKEFPEWKIFSEDKLISNGYKYMRAKNYQMAIKIFKLDIAAYPKSYNGWDSLAEAYMNDGNTEEAIKNYKKSLELNPDNTNAKEMIAKCESL